MVATTCMYNICPRCLVSFFPVPVFVSAGSRLRVLWPTQLLHGWTAVYPRAPAAKKLLFRVRGACPTLTLTPPNERCRYRQRERERAVSGAAVQLCKARCRNYLNGSSMYMNPTLGTDIHGSTQQQSTGTPTARIHKKKEKRPTRSRRILLRDNMPQADVPLRQRTAVAETSYAKPVVVPLQQHPQQVYVPDDDAAWARASVLNNVGGTVYEVRIDGIDDNDEAGQSDWGAGDVRRVDLAGVRHLGFFVCTLVPCCAVRHPTQAAPTAAGTLDCSGVARMWWTRCGRNRGLAGWRCGACALCVHDVYRVGFRQDGHFSADHLALLRHARQGRCFGRTVRSACSRFLPCCSSTGAKYFEIYVCLTCLTLVLTRVMCDAFTMAFKFS